MLVTKKSIASQRANVEARKGTSRVLPDNAAQSEA